MRRAAPQAGNPTPGNKGATLRERLPVVLLHLLMCIPTAWAVPDRLLEVVPADSLAVVLFDRRGGTDDEDGTSTAGRVAAALLEHTRGIGLWHRVDTTVGIVADAISLHPELARYPRAAMLLDVQADPLADGGFRLAGISAGLVVVTGKNHLDIERNIQALLNVYADSDVARLTERKANGSTVHTLADRRLPVWALIE